MSNLTLYIDPRLDELLTRTALTLGVTKASIVRQGIVAAIETNAGATGFTPETPTHKHKLPDDVAQVREVIQRLLSTPRPDGVSHEAMLAAMQKGIKTLEMHKPRFKAAEATGALPRKTYMKLFVGLTSKARHLSDYINATPA